MADAAVDDNVTTTAAAAPPTAPPSAPDLSGLDPATLNRMIQGMLGPQAQAAPPQQPSPSSHEGRGWLSLLGEALGGGEQYGSTAEREQGGLAALGAMGARMLQASDYSYGHHTLGSIIGQGQEAAGQSLAGTQAVSAARQGAAQQYAQQQQENQLQRLKAALPLLQLQQTMRAIGATPSTIGGTGTTGNTSIGSAGSVDVPPDLLPIYQAAAARTGIPVEVLMAQSKQESGFNSGATGSAGEIGIGQILPKTAASPGFGMAGISDPKALRDPATNINFQADYLKAHLPKGADPTDPAALAVALRGYNGGGDPDYVNHVMRFVPGARTALAPPSASPGAPGGAAPPARTVAAPGTPPPATQPATTPTVSRPPPLPPPEPSTGGQAAGPGGPTTGAIPPSPPGSDARLAALRAGMVGAGADPTTLAPGPGSPPAPLPGAVPASSPPAGPSVVAGPGGAPPIVPAGLQTQPPAAPDTQPPAPGAAPPLPFGQTLSQFIAANRVDPPPAQQALWAKESQAQLADLAGQQARAQQAYASARVRNDAAGMATAQSSLNTITAQMAKVRESGTADQSNYYTTQDTNLANQYKEAQGKLIQAGIDTAAQTVADQRKQADAERAQKYAIELEQERGNQTRLSSAAGAVVQRNQKALEAMDADSQAAAKQLPELDALRVLSDNVPDGSADTLRKLAGVTIAGTPLLTYMSGLGMADPTKVGAVQQLQGAISGTVAQLRQGMSMGQLSDRDLDFIQSLGPRLYEDQGTRSAVISYLKQARQQKMSFNAAVSKEMTRPGMDVATAADNVSKTFETTHPIVPRMPQDLYDHRIDPDPTWQQKVTAWAASNNVKINTLMRKPDGSLELIRPPTADTSSGAPVRPPAAPAALTAPW